MLYSRSDGFCAFRDRTRHRDVDQSLLHARFVFDDRGPHHRRPSRGTLWGGNHQMRHHARPGASLYGRRCNKHVM
eukprot:SAG31_NODE_2323_length_5941_cov_3.155255_6_plen_75_part_00